MEGKFKTFRRCYIAWKVSFLLRTLVDFAGFGNHSEARIKFMGTELDKLKTVIYGRPITHE